MNRKLFVTFLLLAAGAAAPAFAGKVYVPVVQRTGGGATYSTEVWLANVGAQERRYEAGFLPADTNGTTPHTPAVRTAVVGGRAVCGSSIPARRARSACSKSTRPPSSRSTRALPTRRPWVPLQYPATARDRILRIPAGGFNVQFGHTAAQAAGGAEFPTYGWTYRDLRIEMVPY